MERDLAKFRDRAAAEAEVATLDVASGVIGRTRVDTVKQGLEEEVRKLVVGDGQD